MSKKSRKEGNRIATLIKKNKTEFYIADADLGDNSDDVVSALNCVIKTLGKMRSAFMIISAGTKLLSVAVHVPDELTDKINGDNWLNASIKQYESDTTKGKNYSLSCVRDETPFKLVDVIRGNGFHFLNKNGLMDDDESSEEFIGFDDL